MSEGIVNRVAESALEVFDLSDYWPKGGIQTLDLTDLAPEGILREQEVRSYLGALDITGFRNAVVRCIMPDAITPQWLWPMLGHLLNDTAYAAPGTTSDILGAYYAKQLTQLDWSKWTGTKVLLKGCADVDIPESAYILAAQELSRVADKLMYGEACSFVPIMKSKA